MKNRAIGRKIRAARLDRGIPQKDLSQMLVKHGIGIYPANLCRIEQGKDDPSWSTVAMIADLLEMPVADLASYDEPKNGHRSMHNVHTRHRKRNAYAKA